MYFVEKLIQLIRERESVVCMGLDPRVPKSINEKGVIPTHLKFDPEKNSEIIDGVVIKEFNKQLIEEVWNLIPIIKPNIAYYEKFGIEGIKALKSTIKYAHKHDLLVILDSKRNDIGPTSEAYADATFKFYGADACTLNGYLGYDSIKPYIEKYPEKGLFILVKTSNPSSKDFQNLFSARLDEIPDNEIEIKKTSISLERNYIHMAKLIRDWGKNLKQFSKFHNIGVVVGATYPNEMIITRNITKNSFILLPGYGAQGATGKDIKFAFNDKGLGGIVNSSRGIMFAYKEGNKYDETQFTIAAKDEIIRMNKEINKEIRL